MGFFNLIRSVPNQFKSQSKLHKNVLIQSTSLIHNPSKPSDVQTKNLPTNRKELYYKSLLNEKGHKNVFFNNYRIAATLISQNKTKHKRILTEYEAKQFVKSLSLNERAIIKNELILDEKEKLEETSPVQNPTFKQITMVCLQNGLPFIGFGFLDNFIMIIAGDAIELYIGMYLPISTMAAAGLGNAFSDVGGIGLAHHIEYYCSRLMQAPKLTPEQWNLPIVGWSSAISKSLCIFIGCIIGMVPLLFIDHETKNEKSNDKSDKSET